MLNALLRSASRETDPRPLAIVRIAVAVAALLRAGEAHGILARVLEPGRVRLPYVPWLPALPDAAASVALAVWAAAALALLVGWRTRIAGVLLALAMGYVLLLDEQTYSNHLYLLVLLSLLLAWGDAGAAYSLDARRRAGRRPVSGTPVLLLRLQLGIVYGFAALSKLNLVFLSGAVLDATLDRDGWLALPAALRTHGVLFPLAALTVMGEAFLALGVWSRRLRPWAFVTALALHGGMVLLLGDVRLQLAVFALEILALDVLFIDAEHRVRLVVWDDQCSFCRSWVTWLRRLDWLGLHRFVGSSEPAAFAGTGITREAADHALQWVGQDGRAAGFDAVRRVLEALPVSFLWAPLLRLSPVRWAGDRAYLAVAARRRCLWAPAAAVARETEAGRPVRR